MNLLKTTLIAAALLLSTASLAAPVNINTATAEEISSALNGIGPAKAEEIVRHRTANGPFKSVEDLTAVKGIGEKTVEKNRNDIKL